MQLHVIVYSYVLHNVLVHAEIVHLDRFIVLQDLRTNY